jgi:hypothetical protein
LNISKSEVLRGEVPLRGNMPTVLDDGSDPPFFALGIVDGRTVCNSVPAVVTPPNLVV